MSCRENEDDAGESEILFFRAVLTAGTPGSVFAIMNPAGSSPCRACERVEVVDASGERLGFEVERDPVLRLPVAPGALELLVREEVQLLSGGSAFAVIAETPPEFEGSVPPDGARTTDWLLARYGGEILGAEPLLERTGARIRVATYATDHEALSLARRFGRVNIDRLDDIERMASRADQMRIVGKAFWYNQCEPESDEARAQSSQWEAVKRAIPEITRAIDCVGESSSAD